MSARRSSHHIEWLSLIEVSGPFLAVGLLDKAFPQGLEKVETPRRQKLRAAYDEWCEAVDEDDAQLLALHREWVQLVLADILEYSQEVLFENGASEEPLEYRDPEHGVSFSPSLVVRSDGATKPRLLISVYPPGTDLEKVKTNDGWPVSLMERMVLLCRSTGVRLGLLTNGDRWMLVNAPVGATSSHASWYARLWFQEPLTLKAFQSLLGIRRFFGPTEETLDSLLEKSLEYQEEVTDTLGAQVRRAVEVLVQCLDKADQDRNRELLRDVSPSELYEAGLTVMMRLVFVLCAEERGLLLLGDPIYDQCYAVSTLRGHLGEDADRHGPEVLERRHDAWTRLLSVFRAVYGGIEHESLRLPAMGGSLFDPDRFPFLEGRLKDTRWRETPAAPLPIDNRTVLLLLEALQVLEQPGGALLLSYRALDVEQIGHVYEGLLEHTVARVPQITVGLAGSKKAKNPNLTLANLESARMDGEAALLTILLEATERSEPALRKDLKREVDAENFGRLLLVCGGDVDLAERIRPFASLLRTDAWGEPIVYRANSFTVTLGADRRETGTHYTPKSLTENIVSTTLEPVAYVGPAEGISREKWRLKSSSELLNLKICDPAMGSGAFLVQACRWLGERVVEAWAYEEASGRMVNIDGEVLESLGDADPMPNQIEDRLIIARRLVAERCLYGIDINPLAVELAKLSIWLVTLAKGRPFGFLDHNLRHGDSLLGVHRLDQLTRLSLYPDRKSHVLPLFEQMIEAPVMEAIELRKRLRAVPIRDIGDVEVMRRLDRQARKSLESVELVADAMIGEVLVGCGNARELDTRLNALATHAGEYLSGNDAAGRRIALRARESLAVDLPDGKLPRHPFHWPLEFPEVFVTDAYGFDAVVGNPPFKGGRMIGNVTGQKYYEWLGFIRQWKKGSPDLCVFFFLRAFSILRSRGNLGMIATSTIRHTGNREVGIEQLRSNGATVYAAYSQICWPGKANVFVSLIWIAAGQWQGQLMLDGKVVEHISGGLDTVGWQEVHKLQSMTAIGSQGFTVSGDGFVLSTSEYMALIDTEPKSKDIVYPFFNGSDLAEMPMLEPRRWIIDFADRSEEEARKWPIAFEHLERLVKPHRDSQSGQIHQTCFWKFWDMRPSLRKAMQERSQLLALPRDAKYILFRFVPSPAIYNDAVKLFFLDEYWQFAALQSTIHSIWGRWRSTTKGATTKKYSSSKSLDTFPWPRGSISRLGRIGKEYDELRNSLMAKLACGLTEIYNKANDPSDMAPDVSKLREAQEFLDRGVMEAYGWDDVVLEHGFHELPDLPQGQNIRFTVCETARLEVIYRLCQTNRGYHEEEVRQGL